MECKFLDRANNNKCNFGGVDEKGNLIVIPMDKDKDPCHLKPENIPRRDCDKFKVWIDGKEAKLRTREEKIK